MIKEIQKVITVTYFVTSDGREFEEKRKAEIHQLRLDGKCKTCNVCSGSGMVPDAEYRYTYTCPQCNGKGYLIKQEVWG